MKIIYLFCVPIVLSLLIVSLVPVNVQSSYLEFSDEVRTEENSNSINLDVVTYQNYAYLSDSEGIAIFDISGGSLDLIGNVSTGTFVTDLVVNNTLLFAALAGTGVYIYDISTPTTPQLLSTVNALGNDITIQGSYLYSTHVQSGFEIYNVSDVLNPSLLNVVSLTGTLAVRADANYAYVFTTYNLQIYDISDILSLSMISETFFSTSATEFIVDNDKAFVPIEGAIHIFDITDRSSTGTFVNAIATLDTAIDLELNGTNLLISDSSVGIDVRDISDINNIVLISTLQISRTVQHIALVDSYILTAMGQDGLEMYDVGDIASGYLLDWYDPRTTYITGLKAVNDTIYTISQFDGLQVWNDYANPVEVGEVQILEQVEEIEILGNYAIVSFGGSSQFAGNNGLLIYDISTDIPVLVSSYNRSYFHDFYIEGNRGYFVDNNNLEVVDLSDPENPDQLSTLTASAEDVHVSGNYVYLDTTYGIEVIDVSDPSSPSVVGSISGLSFTHMTVINDFAYLIPSSVEEIQVVDISNPEDPRYLYGMEFTSNPFAISSWEDYLVLGKYEFSSNYGSDPINTIQIYDTTNPYSLERVGLMNINASFSMATASTFDITQDRIFMALGQDGFMSVAWGPHESIEESDTATSSSTSSSTTDTTTDTSTGDGSSGDDSEAGSVSMLLGSSLLGIGIMTVYRVRSRY